MVVWTTVRSEGQRNKRQMVKGRTTAVLEDRIGNTQDVHYKYNGIMDPSC